MSRPRTYFAKNVYSTDEMLKLLQGKKTWKRLIIETLRKIRCKLTGHFIVHQKWLNKENPMDFEWHVGCTKCPKFDTMPSSTDNVPGIYVT